MKTCGQCGKYLIPGMCPEAEYKDRETNRAARLPTDMACTLFEAKNKEFIEDKSSQASRIVQLALSGIELFHDEYCCCYARVSHSEVVSIHRLRSKDFRIWLAGQLWNEEQNAPTAESINSAINVLESQALFKGPLHRLYNRVAPDSDGEGIWIDMCNDKWQVIHVTADGWKIIDKPPILFRRYTHQQPLPAPVKGGDPKKLLDFANLADDSEGNHTLLIIIIIHFLIPEIPHVLLILFGPQGSTKTTFHKMIRSLIDPSSTLVLGIPKNEYELVQQLQHHWCIIYDNITSLRKWSSDVLSRAVTGGGFTKRELYTDDDDVIYNFRRCLCLNGINIAAQSPDLLDRAVLFGLKLVSKKNRKTEESLWNEFNKVKGEILGGLLDTLSKAIKIYPTVKMTESHRMADFAKWGCAISEALGTDKKKFLEAYDANVKFHTEEAARGSPVAEVLMKFMIGKLPWEGTPSKLYDGLLETAKVMNVNTRQKAWPKAPNTLIRRINELVPALLQLGYEISETRDNTRKVTINTVVTDGTVGDDKNDDGKTPLDDGYDDTDDILHTSSSAPTVREALDYAFQMIGERLPHKTTADNFVHDLVFKGLSQEEAGKLLEKLITEGPLGYDSEGWLVKV